MPVACAASPIRETDQIWLPIAAGAFCISGMPGHRFGKTPLHVLSGSLPLAVGGRWDLLALTVTVEFLLCDLCGA